MPEPILQKTMHVGDRRPFKHGKPCDYHFRALKRILDKQEPDYKD